MPKPKIPVILVRIDSEGRVKKLALPTTKKILLEFYKDAPNNEYLTATISLKDYSHGLSCKHFWSR